MIRKPLVVLSIAISTLLGGCYQVCSPHDVAPSGGPRADTPDLTLGSEPEVAELERGIGENGYMHGEVWAVPRVAASDTDPATSSSSGSNTPWTAVVYTQSAFVLTEDEPLQGRITLQVNGDGTVSASVPDAGAYGASSGMVGDDRSSYRWLKRFSGSGDTPCDVPPAQPRQPVRDIDTNDLLRVQFMLARAPQAAGALAVFGVEVTGSGRDFKHSQVVSSSEKTFSAEFGDAAAPARASTTVAGLRVFRINITAQRVDGQQVIQPGSEGQLIDAKFSPHGHILYVVNLGFVLQDDNGARPAPRTGTLLVKRRAA